MENELMHFGIKGQKWGVRRYYNADGSLTKAGKERRNSNLESYDIKELQKEFYKANKKKANTNTAEIYNKVWSGGGKYSTHLKRMNELLESSYGTALKDLGFEDTEAGREYLKNKGFQTGLWYTKEHHLYDYDE